jgi:outer membrane protein assembly factor BamE (lipoprotein component of BamABCDE complex)
MRTTSSLLVVGSAVLAFLAPVESRAQVKVTSTAATAAIDPGMSKAQVVAKLGKPASERTRGEFTYLFYSNGMEKQVGMADIVTLQSDKVIDAVFRSPRRTYTGTSSSPRAIPAQEAAKRKAPPKGGAPAP